MKVIRAIALATLAAVTVGLVLAAPSGGVGPPESLGPPHLPGPFAAFESVLQANRGNAPLIQVTTPGYSNRPTIVVKDGKGSYEASLRQGGGTLPNGHVLPSILTQLDLGSDQATVWPVDPNTGLIAGPAAQSTYSTIHYRKPTPNDPTTPPPGFSTPGATLSVVHKTHPARLAGNYAVSSNFCVQRVIAPALVLYVYWWLDADTSISCIEPAAAIIAGQQEEAWLDLQWHNLLGASTVGGAVSWGVWIGTGVLNQCLNPGGSSWYYRLHGWGIVEYGGTYVTGNGYSNTPNPLWPCQDSPYFTGVDPG